MILIFSNNVSGKCNWNGRIINFSAYYTCDGLGGQVAGDVKLNDLTGVKFEWKRNGTIISKNYHIDFWISDGSYEMCLKISDTINNCDTSMCIKVVKDCTSNCNWKNRIMYNGNSVFFGTKCEYKSINGDVYLANSKNVKYEWSVEGNPVKANLPWSLQHVITDGTYKICLKMTDTLLNCDTTICSTVVKNCAGCYWSERIQEITFGQSDSCPYWQIGGNVVYVKGDRNINYNWKVDGVVQSKDPSPRWFYKVVPNGTYNVCVELSDTFLNCDTSICKTLVLDCNKLEISHSDYKSGFTIYPNPVKDALYLRIGDAKIAKIELYDFEGKLVLYPIPLKEEGFLTLNLNDIRNGIYLLKMQDMRGETTIIKLIKE